MTTNYIISIDEDGTRTSTELFNDMSAALKAWFAIKDDKDFYGYAGITTMHNGIEIDYADYLN